MENDEYHAPGTLRNDKRSSTAVSSSTTNGGITHPLKSLPELDEVLELGAQHLISDHQQDDHGNGR